MVLICLWKLKTNPQEQEMKINKMTFLILNFIDTLLAVYFNYFIWEYINHNIVTFQKFNFDIEYHHIKRLLLYPIMIVSWITIATYAFIILAFTLVVIGGYLTGRWELSRNKANVYNEAIDKIDNRKATVKLTSQDKAVLQGIIPFDSFITVDGLA